MDVIGGWIESCAATHRRQHGSRMVWSGPTPAQLAASRQGTGTNEVEA